MSDRPIQQQLINFSTSSLTEYQRCPREWYWGHGYRRGELVECDVCPGMGSEFICPVCQGQKFYPLRGGIESTSGKLPLAIGSGTHKGIEVILNWFIGRSGISYSSDLMDQAINEAVATFDQEIGADFPRDSFEYMEGFHMTWALVRVFERTYLPSLLQNYEVLLAERMIHMPWSDGFQDRVKCDAILRSRQTGRIVILSIKTAASLSEDDIEAHSISSQGNNEIIATEHWAKEQGINEPVERYRMLFLLKGQSRKQTETIDGQERVLFRYHDNPILHPWMLKATVAEMNRYTGQYKWMCTQEHEHRWTKGGICPGYKNHTLGKDWERLIDPGIWGSEHIGIEGMIDYLAEYEPQVLGKMIVSPFEHTREQAQLDSWKQQTNDQIVEQEVHLDDLNNRMSLDQTFRQHTHSCRRFNSRCAFWPLCWGQKDSSGLVVRKSAEELIEEGVYRLRMEQEQE